MTDYSQTRDGKVGTETQRNMGFIHGAPCAIWGFLLTPEPRLQTRDGKVGTETQRNMGFIHGTPCTVRGFLLTPEPRLRYLVRGAEREGGGVEEEREMPPSPVLPVCPRKRPCEHTAGRQPSAHRQESPHQAPACP